MSFVPLTYDIDFTHIARMVTGSPRRKPRELSQLTQKAFSLRSYWDSVRSGLASAFRAHPKTSWPGSHARQFGGVGAASARFSDRNLVEGALCTIYQYERFFD
jgi:hypothetical protein